MQKSQALMVIFSVLFGAILFTTFQNEAKAETDDEKAQVQRCESLYPEYLEIGETKFVERHVHFRTDRNCVKLFNDPVWNSEQPDRIEILVRLVQQIEGDSRLLKERSIKNYYTISDWMKDDAKRWYEGKTTDVRFAFVIRKMIESKIITAEIHDIFTIPQWVKKNTQWWIEEKISASEYITSIEYLMKKGIMQV